MRPSGQASVSRRVGLGTRTWFNPDLVTSPRLSATSRRVWGRGLVYNITMCFDGLDTIYRGAEHFKDLIGHNF